MDGELVEEIVFCVRATPAVALFHHGLEHGATFLLRDNVVDAISCPLRSKLLPIEAMKLRDRTHVGGDVSRPAFGAFPCARSSREHQDGARTWFEHEEAFAKVSEAFLHCIELRARSINAKQNPLKIGFEVWRCLATPISIRTRSRFEETAWTGKSSARGRAWRK
jgi:hypothetical protein